MVIALTLRNRFNDINFDKWKYYSELNYENYNAAIDRPLNFIRDYFCIGGKDKFLYNGIFDFQEDDSDQNKRALHTVNTFFLGIYLLEKIDFLYPSKSSFLGTDKNLLWAWFICSLYHDAFFNVEYNQFPDLNYNFSYCNKSQGLLYNPSQLEKYYNKGINSETCHRTPHPDHGIYAAEKLYENYVKNIKELLVQNNNLEHFLCGNNVNYEYSNLKVNLSCYNAICKISKIIASHNVFSCDINKPEEILKYKNSGLKELIPNNPEYRYMPNIKDRNSMTSYEKLYFLLALVDSIEYSKREIDADNIEINIEAEQKNKHIIFININEDINDETKKKYFNGVCGLNSWLNFVTVENEGKTIIVDFNCDKNK